MVVKNINCLISDGTTCKIDLKFYKEFKKYNWYCDRDGYIATSIQVNGKHKILKLHHYVLNFKYDPNIDLVADHKFGNKRDHRLKKLRLVSHRINSLNQRGRTSNTGFSNISYYYHNNNPYYIVSYLNIYNLPDSKWFLFIEGVNEVDVFQEAFDFSEDIKKTLPHYIEAFPNIDDDSSSGESIEEVNFEDIINPNRLRPTNTSTHKKISDNDTYWLLSYYNKKGKPTTKRFNYFPKSDDTKNEALEKTLLFQKQNENNPHKKRERKKKQPVINNITNNITINIVGITKKKKKKSKNITSNCDFDLIIDENKQIPKKSLLLEEDNDQNDDLMMDNQPKKSLFDLMMNDQPKKSLFDLLLEDNIDYEESMMIIDSSDGIDIK
jgi:hypothetical protein